jgi:hypothetical protein
MTFSLLLDFSGSTGFGTWRIFVPLFWVTCRLFSIFLLFWVLECFFCLWILYTLFTLVLLRHWGGVIIFWFFSYSVLPFVLLWQKRWVFFFFIWTRILFLTDQQIFVLEWPKWEFVSLWLTAFCWTKSLLCNDAYYIGMLFYLESTLQLWASRRLCVEFKMCWSVPLHLFGRRGFPSGRSSIKHHSSGRCELSVRTSLCV